MAENRLLEVFQDADSGFLNSLLDQTVEGVLCVTPDKRIVFWNKAAEQLTGYERSETIGRSCARDLPLHLDQNGVNICRDRCPMDQVLREGTTRTLNLYLQHREGYRVPIELRIMPVLKASGEVLGAVEFFSATTPRLTLPMAVGELERINLLDKDSGIPNRKYLEMQLSVRLDEFLKFEMPFALLYIDVDNYNKILEKYGRFNAGKLLRMIARTLHKNIRYLDVVGRWGTEEFLVLILNIDENRLDIIANKLRLLVEESYIMVETGALSTTISIGASLIQRYDTADSLIKRTEQLMMHSKWRGKNKVSLSFVRREEF
jgi:diguanylate cyclase (GGDEF)-like protein/PAS domain S-box-containing protein